MIVNFFNWFASPEKAKTDANERVESWSKYIETHNVVGTITTADKIFTNERTLTSNEKWHTFEYVFEGTTLKAILKENLDDQSEPVIAQETHEGWMAKILINPNAPTEYEFVYCACGNPH